MPGGVQLVMRPGRGGELQSTGMAYVQFAGPAEASRARAERHHAMIGSRYVEVQLLCLKLHGKECSGSGCKMCCLHSRRLKYDKHPTQTSKVPNAVPTGAWRHGAPHANAADGCRATVCACRLFGAGPHARHHAAAT